MYIFDYIDVIEIFHKTKLSLDDIWCLFALEWKFRSWLEQTSIYVVL